MKPERSRRRPARTIDRGADQVGHGAGRPATDHYTDAEMKRQALEKTEAPALPKRVPSWKRNKDLLAWLEAL